MPPLPPPPLPRWMKETNYCLDMWERINKQRLKEKMLLSRRDVCVPALSFQFKGLIVRDYILSGTIKKKLEEEFLHHLRQTQLSKKRQFNFLCKGPYLKNFSFHQTSAKQINQPTNQPINKQIDKKQ